MQLRIPFAFILGTLLLIHSNLSSQVLLTEDFTYSPGPLSQTFPTWSSSAGTMAPASIAATAGDRDNSLYLPGAGDPVGRRFRLNPALDPSGGGWNILTRTFPQVTTASATVYLSFLVKVESAPTSSSIPRILSLTGGGAPSVFFAVASTSTPGIGQIIWHRKLFDPLTAGPTIPLNQTVFIVMASPNDSPGPVSGTAQLWVNPQRGLLSPPTPDATLTTSVGISGQNEINLSVGPMSGNIHEVDNIKIGLSWTDATSQSNAAAVSDWYLYSE